MSRKTFLTIASLIALAIGALALLAPVLLLGTLKAAVPNAAAIVMARTAGVLLLSVGLLGYLVRDHGDSPTMEAILKANLFLQLCLLPVDPFAYLNGTYATLASFVPNTVIHILLAAGFVYYLLDMRRARSSRGVAGDPPVALSKGD